MAKITINSILKRSAEVRYTSVPEGGLVVHHEKAEILTLNPIAIEIFDKLDGKKKVSEILKEIIKNYDVEENEAEKDILEFLNDLFEKNLIIVL